jgi:hypothetical protein
VRKNNSVDGKNTQQLLTTPTPKSPSLFCFWKVLGFAVLVGFFMIGGTFCGGKSSFLVEGCFQNNSLIDLL